LKPLTACSGATRPATARPPSTSSATVSILSFSVANNTLAVKAIPNTSPTCIVMLGFPDSRGAAEVAADTSSVALGPLHNPMPFPLRVKRASTLGDFRRPGCQWQKGMDHPYRHFQPGAGDRPNRRGRDGNLRGATSTVLRLTRRLQRQLVERDIQPPTKLETDLRKRARVRKPEPPMQIDARR